MLLCNSKQFSKDDFIPLEREKKKYKNENP